MYSLPELNDWRGCIRVCDVGGIFSIVVNTILYRNTTAYYYFWVRTACIRADMTPHNKIWFPFLSRNKEDARVGLWLGDFPVVSYLYSSSAHSQPKAAQWWSSWRGRRLPRLGSLYSTRLDELQSPVLHSQYLKRQRDADRRKEMCLVAVNRLYSW